MKNVALVLLWAIDLVLLYEFYVQFLIVQMIHDQTGLGEIPLILIAIIWGGYSIWLATYTTRFFKNK
jgi:hypothetical protein